MDWLNYHHLLYFWTAAREGGIARAGAALHLSVPTVSAQVKALERALGEKLLEKRGRGVGLTEMGRVVYRFADEIFSLGRELVDTVKGRPTGRPARLAVGIADVVPKLVAKRLLEPALRLAAPVRLVCREDRPDRLLAELATHALDVVISDSPVPSTVRVKAFGHPLVESGVSFFAARAHAARYRRRFPASLDGAPMLLPSEGTSLRRAIDAWLGRLGLRPAVVVECADSALTNVFGEGGFGVFPSPSIVAGDLRRRYRVAEIGVADGVRETYYALTTARRIEHPAVLAVRDAARSA